LAGEIAFFSSLLVLLPVLAAAQNPAPPVPGQPLRIGLKQAVAIALAPEGSTRVRLAEEFTRQARAQSSEARAALLPNFDASLTEESVTQNLAVSGITQAISIPGLSFPRLIGPYDIFDARIAGSQTIFDFSALRHYQSARAGIRAAEADRDDARDQTATQVATLYMDAQAAVEHVEAAEADVALAEADAKLAGDRKKAGTGIAIDLTRALVELANARQRLLVAQNGLTQAHLQLLRAMGVSLDTTVELTETLAYSPFDEVAASSAVTLALKSRADYLAQLRREDSARLSYSAVKFQRLPSVSGFGNYGTTGLSIDNAVPTRTYGVSVKLPLFDGGRRDAQRAESASALRQQSIRTADLRQQVELEIRLALDALHSSADQVKAAEEGLTQSEQEVAQAQRRYSAGFATSLETTDAQTRLERARDNRIAALLAYNISRVNLAQAMGAIREVIR
jgi:outer membrane protein TolC